MTAWRARPSSRAWRRLASRATSRPSAARPASTSSVIAVSAVELVVDPLVDGPLLGVDQGAAGEGEPDLALGAPLVIQRHQLVQELLGRAPGVARRLEGADAGLARSQPGACRRPPVRRQCSPSGWP